MGVLRRTVWLAWIAALGFSSPVFKCRPKGDHLEADERVERDVEKQSREHRADRRRTAPDFGSDEKYQTYHAHAYGSFPVDRQFVLGVRFDARTARGDVPFYQLPYIDMRGIPAARYQDENAGVAEAELRWNLTPRWALIGFAGTVRTWGRT